LLIISKAAMCAEYGLPIADRRCLPPLSALNFYTDAAGGKYNRVKGIYHQINEPERGVACLGGADMDNIWMWSRFSWPTEFLKRADEKGVEYGRKSTTLESIALLIPFLCTAKQIAGRHLVFHVDNIAVHYGWESASVKNDSSATCILKIVHVLASFLGCHVHVLHVPRVSNEMADLADELTRKVMPDSMRYKRSLSKGKFFPCNNDFVDMLVSGNYENMCSKILYIIKKAI